ncbi:MAG: right-handed parallel beta-helix repeat-containing protein [Ruminococcaceae bacterium]|nr:right-handed parallel beta-helix repeat-containing protein [Oscillospiraceae bacterium]
MSYVNDQYSILPNGKPFEFWDCETEFTKTYYVSKAANASDENPGTAEAPFATISKAAEILEAGERVVIGGGVYDEFVRPVNGGNCPKSMISYEAAPGERVILTGAKEYKNGFTDKCEYNTIGLGRYYNYTTEFNPDAKCYQGYFNQCDFDKINPFAMVNCASQPFGGCEFWFEYLPREKDWAPFLKRRGLIMVDGEPLWQVNFSNQLSQVPGSYWVEDSGYKFIIRLKDDSDPRDHVITYTCRDQLFSPINSDLGYIRVKGLEFEFVGNGVPGSQKGALSTHCGHHWILEENKVRWANGLGIDIGNESPMRSREIQHDTHMIVRRNHVSNCGVCGIAGLGRNQGILLEGNVLDGNCWHDIEYNYESGAIKVHGVHDGLIRYNVITNNGYGPGIWTDYANANERICYNTIVNCKSMVMGAIFIEATDIPCRTDHNIIINGGADPTGSIPQRTSGGGHGFYQHDSDNLLTDNNIMLGLDGAGVFLNWGDPVRITNGHGPLGYGHKVMQNIIADCGRGYVMPTVYNEADGNIMGAGSFSEQYCIGVERNNEILERLDMRSARSFHGWDKTGKMCQIDYDTCLDCMKLTMKFTVGDECLEQVYDLTQEVRLDLTPVQEFLAQRDCSAYEAHIRVSKKFFKK